MNSHNGHEHTDIILSMAHTATEDYMQQIVQQVKSYEFRKRLYPSSVVRIWFYETAPISSVTYICEIDPAHVRGQAAPLPDDGIGNVEYNQYHPDWHGYDYAYRIKSCWRIKERISLDQMKEMYGIGGAPRGMVHVPEKMKEDVRWDRQELVWREDYD